MRLIIIGSMASGKSTVGRKLSKKLGLNFFDIDNEIEKKAGAKISWIFDVEGEEKFRDREYEAFSNLIINENCVISTGGGIVLREENRELLNKGTVIYLEISIQTQLERTINDKDRPLLYATNKEKTLRKIAEIRNPIYEAYSDITIKETNDPNEAADLIVLELKK
jgi:shikimate kinase